MNFNNDQQKIIYEFKIKYDSGEQFRKMAQELYDNKLSQLSILHIYALEEVLRYGTKEIYKKFLVTKGTYSEEQAVNLFDGFIRLLNEDENFKQYKLEQLKMNPETLSTMEIFAFELINHSAKKEENASKKTTEKLKYDALNPILYGDGKQIRETLENLYFGEMIHDKLEHPTMKPIKDRQKESGMIASTDKPFIIKEMQELILMNNFISKFDREIKVRYFKVSLNLMNGKREDAFEPFLKFNTNISANEIFGSEKDMTKEDMVAYLKDIIYKKQAENGSFTENDAMDFMDQLIKKHNKPTKR